MRKLTRISWGLTAVVCVAAPAVARAEDLAEAIAYAYDYNPGLLAQRAAVRALDETFVQARSGYGVTVNASASASSYELRRSRSRADAETDSVGVAVAQPLYTGGRVRARMGEAEAQLKGGREQLRRVEMEVLQRVVAAYVGVRRDERLLEVARDTEAVLARGLRDTEAKVNAKTSTLTDLMQSRARLAQARTQRFSVEEQLAASRAQYLAVVGRLPGTLKPPPSLVELPQDADAAFDAAEGNNPQLLAARYAEEGSRARIARAKAGLMPNVVARFDVQRGPFQPYQPGPYETSIASSVTVSQPLYAAGQLRSAIRQAVEENNRDRLTVDDVRLQTIQNVTTAWERLSTLRRQLVSLEEEVKTNRLAFLGVTAEERFALRSNIEVLNAASELNNAQQSEIRVRAAEYLARAQLLQQLGLLTPRSFGAAVRIYDPADNTRDVAGRGQTPLEIPVRVLDKLSPAPGRAPPPAIPTASRPAGASLGPAPGPEQPFISTATALETMSKTAPRLREQLEPDPASRPD